MMQAKRRYFEGFPPGALDGSEPTLQFGGGSLGFGGDRADVMVSFGDKVRRVPAERALFHLDRFIESSRARLVLMAGCHYGVTLDREAAVEPLYDMFNSEGTRLLAGVELDTAHQIRDEHQAEPDVYPEWQGEITLRLIRGAYLDKRAPTK
ncbi:MAG: hypothetical protein ACOH2S_27510 [Janthinobacterium svalbardensis]|uniref:Uncharacterized protein n=1 Tax=Janthinobacterium svalbardensis TaxID=368607 RepID=A0A290X079_9BURK|nr:hypothetical protein [Janthinobacterium svalbardensis]ATD62523.1 hypothetical protein CNX70_22010 [Janthinobacterium svalbardensis]